MIATHKEDSLKVYVTEDGISHRLFCRARNPLAAAMITEAVNGLMETNSGFKADVRQSIIEQGMEC